MEKMGMLVGEKGVKYGLQRPAAAKKPAAPAKAKPSIFGADSDSEEDVGTQVARQADKKRAAAKVQQMYESALAEDPSVFDYDGVYDEMRQASALPKQQEKVERKSRYIAQLKEQAEERKKESDVAFERKALKDRVKEDHLFADKEVFVTGAYRRKLEEQQKWLEAEKRKEEEEQRHDVRKVGHMGNFYANLLSNVAFGGKGKKDAGEGADADAAAASGGDQSNADGAAAVASSSGRGKEEEAEEEEEDEAKLVAAAAKAGVTLDKYELMRLQAERARKQRQAATAAEQGQGAVEVEAEVGRQPAAEARMQEPVAGSPRDTKDAAPDSGDGEATAGGTAAAAAAAAHAAKRRNDDTSVQSARERYLARKKQAT